MLRGWAGTVLVFLLLTPAVEPADRAGFLIGFDLGGGTRDCRGCTSSGAVAAGFHIGGSISDTTSLAADLFSVGGLDEFDDQSLDQTLLSVQHWVASRLWVGGGLGIGRNRRPSENGSGRGPTGFAFAVQGGVEILQRGKFALDVRARYGRNLHSPTSSNYFTVLAGLTWY